MLSPTSSRPAVLDGCKRIFSPETINYILRLYLPYWRIEERLQEILAWCRETETRHVMLFTEAQYLVWNQLSSADMAREIASLRRAKAVFDDHGITLGINATYNMRVSRTDHRGHLDYDYWATYADGVCDYRTPCLLDPKLDRYLEELFAALASVQPAFIYVDDDHRYMLQGERETWGCFCDLHLCCFGDHVGTTWTRPALRDALREDQAVRRAWRAFLGERLVALAQVMRRAVQRVSPNTKVGMMVPSVHTLPALGHTLANVLEALHPVESPALVRPCIGGYQDWQRRDLFAGLYYMEFVRHILGDDVEYTPEIETTPGSRLAKSLAVTRYQIAQGILNGMPNPAISAASYDGDSPCLEPDFAPMLRTNRPYFEALRRAAPARGTRRGVQLRWEFSSPDHVRGKVEAVSDLDWPAFVAAQILGHLGIPSTFDDSPLRLMIGDSVCCLDETEIRTLLSGGLLLDARAAHALGEMGYAGAIGCDVGETLPVSRGERLTDPAMSGQYTQCLIPLRGHRLESVKSLQPRTGSRIVSKIVDDDLCMVSAGVTLFTNAFGGRIAVLPYALHAQDGEMRHLIRYHRREQLRRILAWMCPDAVPLWLLSPSDVGVQVWEDAQQLTVCLTNLSFDIQDQVIVEMSDTSWHGGHGRYLTRTGAWQSLADLAMRDTEQPMRWHIPVALAPFDPVVFIFERCIA
jgi:hypothetical protein